MKIRKAIVEDATGIGTVHVDSWRTTYKDIIPDEFLEKCAGVPIYRSNCATAINLKSLNVFDKYASEVFEDMVASEDTFYLVFSFTGIEKEAPSFDIARRLEIKNRFYWDLENSLFLGMGCLCKRFDLFNLLMVFQGPILSATDTKLK